MHVNVDESLAPSTPSITYNFIPQASHNSRLRRQPSTVSASELQSTVAPLTASSTIPLEFPETAMAWVRDDVGSRNMASSESLHGVSVTGAEPAVESATNSEQAATNAVNAPLCRQDFLKCLLKSRAGSSSCQFFSQKCNLHAQILDEFIVSCVPLFQERAGAAGDDGDEIAFGSSEGGASLEIEMFRDRVGEE
nr:hypothetical protein Iba_chr02bCG12270 [Ipomoea batatas]